MNFIFNKGKITQNFKGGFEITLEVSNESKYNIELLNDLFQEDCLKTAEIKKYHKRRSLNANNYAWSILTQIADVLRSNKEEVYLQMLKRYGQSSVVSVIDEAVPIFLKSVKYAEEFGHGTVNGKSFTHIKVYMGSSEFDTKQMSVFLDGVISEATALKIGTLTDKEIQRLKENWEGLRNLE